MYTCTVVLYVHNKSLHSFQKQKANITRAFSRAVMQWYSVLLCEGFVAVT